MVGGGYTRIWYVETATMGIDQYCPTCDAHTQYVSGIEHCTECRWYLPQGAD